MPHEATEHQLEVLQHAIGADQYGRREQYGSRNYYVAGEGHHSWDALLALTAAGLMNRRQGNALTGGDDLFTVTSAGFKHVANHSPAPPKQTRAQKRYDDFLSHDSGMNFGEWLQRGCYRS